MSPGAVIFDMDGLMLDSERIYRDAWQGAAAVLGYRIHDDLYHELIGRGNEDGEAILLDQFGTEFPVEEFRRNWIARWREAVRADGVAVKPGLHELLDFLEQRRLPKAVATSTGRDEALFTLGDLAKRFGTVVTGDQVARGKPEPDIFLAAAGGLGVDPEQCLVLEDSEPGVVAARAAGMSVIIVPDMRRPSDEIVARADRLCESLHEVREFLSGQPKV